MIDINLLRKDLAGVIDCLKTRKDPQPWIDEKNFLQLESNRKTIQSKTEEFRSQLNKLNKQIGINKSKGESAEDLMQQAEAIKTEMADNEARLTKIQIEMESILLSIPNLPHPSVPVGKGEADNMEVRRWSPEGGLGGNPKPLPFPIKDHIELSNGDIDFESASKISGSRFAVIKGGTALLHRTLAQMMLNTHISNHGYTECQVPYIVNAETLQGTGQLPKFKEDLFVTQKGGEDQNDLYLIPTSEVPLTNLVREKILKKEDLPIKLTAHTPCFRSEAGSYGKDTKGLIRQHQFDKVEMVQIVHPKQSYAALEEMLNHAERILQKLELPYRVMNLCTADIGFAAAKTYDIEVWIPSQNCYREIASISNCEDFQARRMQARFKNNQGKTEFVHTLNGSGLAVGRTLIALLENHQTEKGDVVIPEALHPYFIGIG